MHPFLSLAAASVLLASCTSTVAYRHGNGSVTVAQKGADATASTYWITGAPAGKITVAEDLGIFRKFTGKSLPAVPLKCTGFIDTTAPGHVEIRLLEKQGGSLSQAWVNGRHKLVDESAPKPFYHWLIP